MPGTKVEVENGKQVQEKKVSAVAALKAQFANYEDLIFADYRGLKFEQITALRAQLRERNGIFKIVKNRAAKIALHQLGRADASVHLTGPTAVALAKGDSAAVAKLLFDFARDTPLSVKGGLIEGGVFDKSQVESFSQLPGRSELLAMLMGTMNAPLQNLLYALNGVTQKLVRTLKAVADAKASTGADAGASAS